MYMIVYYTRGDLKVTDRYLRQGALDFPIAELGNLRTIRGARSSRAVVAMMLGSLILLATLITIALLGRETLTWGGLALAVLAGLLTIVARRLQPRTYELWGDYRGLPLLIYRTRDEREFGQVARALLRARESAWTADDLSGRPSRPSRPAEGTLS